jgi:uncharacterized BrkB/YihY/UPF0761 family membrane protein
MATGQRSFVDKRRGDTVINVIIGAVVAVVLSSFMPLLAQVIGGAIAGYLQQESRSQGAKVGAIANVLASIPAILLVLLFVPFLGVFFLGGDLALGAFFSGVGLIVIAAGILFAIASAAVVGALGGYLGVVMNE